MLDFRKILAIKLRDLGDTALWTSSLMTLRSHLPKSEIHCLVLDRSRPLLEEHPAIDALHGIPSASGLKLGASLWRLRKQSFDLVLGFHANTSLCRYISLVGAKAKALHHHSWEFTPKSSTISIPEPGKLENAWLRDYQILRALGIHSSPVPSKLVVTEAEKSAALARWGASDKPTPLPRLALLPGARVPTRRYPKDLWEKLVDSLIASNDSSLWVLADPELSKAWDLPDFCGRRNLLLSDRMSLRELMANLSVCQLAVGNDSGPIHIAAALGLKTLTIFGPGCYGDWHPYELKDHPAARIEVPCRADGPRDKPLFQYCRLTECSHLSCLRGQLPEELARQAQRLI